MKLNLHRPICFFDLETTGTNISKDRIVEISIHKVFPDGAEKTFTYRVNPTVNIPAETTAVHGITNEMVENEPTFKELAHKINNLINDSDLAGFNSNRFDIPLLAEEMLRAGVDFDMGNRNAIDIQNIFHKMEQRTLVAAYKFYCDKELTNAHSAEADNIATFEVLEAQLDKYDDLENNVKFLSDFSRRNKNADLMGRIIFNDDDVEVFNFGKHKGKTVTYVLENEPSYYKWMMNGDFPLYTKKILTAIKLRDFNKK